MTTNQLKARLENGLFSESDYNAFIRKHKIFIESILGTRYCADRYHPIDVNGIFHAGFKRFMSKDLCSLNRDVKLEIWEESVIRKRAYAIREDVEHESIRALLKKGGFDSFQTAIPLLYEAYDKVVRNIVTRYYDAGKYNGKRDELAHVLKHIFLVEFLAGPCNGAEVDNLEGWFFTVLRNYAIKKDTREQIDIELGVGNYDDETKIDKGARMDDEEQDAEEPEESQAAPIEKNGEYEDVATGSFGEDVADEPIDIVYTAEGKVARLLSLMPNKGYAELIRAIVIEGVERDVIAEDEGISMAALYNRINEAMTMLMTVALPQIQNFSRHVYAKSRHLLEDEEDVRILDQFFRDQKSIREMSSINFRTEKKMRLDVINAFKLLLKLHQSDLKESQKCRPKDFERKQREDNAEYELNYKMLMS